MHSLTSRNLRLAIIGSVALLVPQAASRADRFTIDFDPSNFSHPLRIDNAFFTLNQRSLQVFRGKSDDGCELDRMTITDNTKVIEHVEARVVHDIVFEDPRCDGSFEKTEDTLDYFAQDDDGNVWYLGEISQDCEDGNCKRNEGTWIAGEDIFKTGTKAIPGIAMLAHPRQHVGETYRQEFYPGHAVDEATVVQPDVTVELHRSNALPPKVFHHCINTKETTALEPDVVGHKYYCPNVGFVLETEQPGNFRSERMKPGTQPDPANDALRFRTVPR
jgi:hypothetical protein